MEHKRKAENSLKFSQFFVGKKGKKKANKTNENHVTENHVTESESENEVLSLTSTKLWEKVTAEGTT